MGCFCGTVNHGLSCLLDYHVHFPDRDALFFQAGGQRISSGRGFGIELIQDGWRVDLKESGQGCKRGFGSSTH